MKKLPLRYYFASSPFGWEINLTSSIYNSYRYSYNGTHLKDNEISGNGNHFDFGGYGLDPRIGRRWNLDPVLHEWQSDYSVFANNPIVFADPSGLDAKEPDYSLGKPPENPQNGDLWQNDAGVTYRFNGKSWGIYIPPTEEKLSLQRNQYFPVQRDNGEFRTAPELSLGNFGNKWHAYNQTEPTNSNALWIGLSKLTYSFTDDVFIFFQIKQLGEGNLNNGVIKHLNGVKTTPQEIGVLLLSYGLAVVGGEFLAAESKPTFNMIEYAAAEAEKTAIKTSTQASEEVTVYRVFGGDSRAQGFSWTGVNPELLEESLFRNMAGLPSGGPSGSMNSAEFLVKGKASILDIINFRHAIPLDGNIGGLPEYVIDPKNVKLIDFKVLKP